jgi:rSAM/selenodomain-associated transferase 2
MKISIIIPVFNEEKALRSYLQQLRLSENEELIVVDGGSTDETVAIAREFSDKVFSTETGRASVMNYGAERASGEILLFLHADCKLPENVFNIIKTRLSESHVAAGAFLLKIDHKGAGFRMIESVSNWRAKMTGLLYGDQGMFLKKDLFEKIGGFADIPLMEDIEISGRLKKEGKIIFVSPPITVSPRRWVNEGIIYTTLRDWYIAFSYTFLKVSPEKLIKYYREIR